MGNLTLIGEKINYSIPRIGRMMDAGNLEAISKVARLQEESGADYIDVNVGPLSCEMMRDVVAAVQEAVAVPLCIDSTDPALLEAGAEAYDAGMKAGGRAPILNSAIESNADRVLAIRARFKCKVVLLVSERMEGGLLERNVLPAQAVETARRLFAAAREAGFAPDDVLIDPGTPPVASDLEGLVNTALETIAGVAADPDLRGAHVVVGLSNFTAGLPRQVRLPLQNAFLTLAVANGLGAVIGDPAREYRILDEGSEELAWLERILASTGTRRLEVLTSYSLYRKGGPADN
jgi:5-methyltetrahydrofolate--homocysteine methyltransferase